MDGSAPRRALVLRVWPASLLLLAGGLHALSVGWPFAFGWARGHTLWPVQIAAMALLAGVLLRSRSARGAFAAGWGFGTAYLAATFWWLFVAMHTYGGLAAPLALVAVFALAGLLALYFGAACGLWWRWSRHPAPAGALLFGTLWMMAEMARGTWLTGFGWGAGGYAHLDGPLAFYAPWVGVYGITGLAAGLGMVLAGLLARRAVAMDAAPPWSENKPLPATASASRKSQWLAALAMLAPLLAPAAWNDFTRSNGTLAVTLLQGNIPQNEKFEASTGIVQALEWYRQELLGARTPLVVAPETAIAVLPQQLPEGYWEDLRAAFAPAGRTAIIGIPLGDEAQGYSNSVLGLVGGQAQPLRYDKHHLVPFGEFIPPLFRWFTELMHIPLGDFNRGALGQRSMVVQGQRLAPNICYEDLFGEELAARFGDAALAPTVFVNVSNLAWFGDTVAVDQHLAISRMRTLEFQRPFVRATNTGATAILDHQGRTVAALPYLTAGALVGEVQGRVGVTPFAWWAARFGLWPLWWFALGVLAWAWWAKPRLR
ncbi:MAG: apolipoprotein N-acyltransferase [Rhodoferax sp.]|nr:apolipoprotein N-acyltransferase [Rhodoferax sp.]